MCSRDRQRGIKDMGQIFWRYGVECRQSGQEIKGRDRSRFVWDEGAVDWPVSRNAE